jgi:putative transposase
MNRQRPALPRLHPQRRKDLDLRDISRSTEPRTTVPGSGPDSHPASSSPCAFVADAPDRLWVADITYCRPKPRPSESPPEHAP